jgi:hypothetical protein
VPKVLSRACQRFKIQAQHTLERASRSRHMLLQGLVHAGACLVHPLLTFHTVCKRQGARCSQLVKSNPKCLLPSQQEHASVSQ